MNPKNSTVVIIPKFNVDYANIGRKPKELPLTPNWHKRMNLKQYTGNFHHKMENFANMNQALKTKM